MNRFRTKKKGKDEDGVPRASQESESSMPFRGFRKAKKSQEAEKKELDLATALPSNDDFRTSLLMTGLSARFSMLREQDDPNTKIGKASDDSVLYPKRQSRMDLASFRGLGDIAEVDSLKTASPLTRLGSYHSDDADSLNTGSIMSRAKPTEGNNLFGGRQKIYKIPATASSSRPLDGGMGGRALYDDDVAHSAFQKWRKAEKERELSQDEPDDSDTLDNQRNSADLEPPQSDSPTSSTYEQKRETYSTLSSIPSVARRSSAATSVTSSQPTPSLKDWQPSSGYSSGPERSVTRTRRLYETGFFTQDNQDPAAGNLSRMDTLNRQRPFGARTPDLSQQPSSLGFSNRLSGERRLLAKGSAPNLRSMSPPASASSAGALNLGIRVPSVAESKSNSGAAPPLSPPISETDENGILSINPNDRGKATALGVFRKPAQPYDESRYAERQLQLQRGRETPTQRARDEPNPPASRDRSPVQCQESPDSPTVPMSETTRAPIKEEAQATSFLIDSDRSETSPMVSPQIHIRRPSDKEHPALRDSVSTTPLSLVTKSEGELSSILETSSSLAVDMKGVSPADSPTLGPVGVISGLSGMVRQHLRADSNASSIYESAPPPSAHEVRFPATVNSNVQQEHGLGSTTWEGENHSHDWNLDLDVNEPIGDTESLVSNSGRPTETKVDLSPPSNENTDEFASQLADGARRIRERLTSYVETDSRSSSPHRLGENTEVDSAPPPRPSGLGAILRPKSSKGSLTDRGRDPSSTRAFKMMGISPGGSRTSSPGSESHRGQVRVDKEPGQDGEERGTAQGSDDQHPGLRQFRQARRELQRIKERELQSRHCPAPQGPPPDVPSPRQRTMRSPEGSRIGSTGQDHKPPPVYYQQRVPYDEIRGGDLSPALQSPSRSDRQRSESGSGHGARSNGRTGRPSEELVSRDTHFGPARSALRPIMRSPGLPGTDIKRSHIMPPQPHPNTSNRNNQYDPNPIGNLHVLGDYESGQSSPIPVGGSFLAGSAPVTPVTSDNRLHSDSRVAPPVPPLNPRRRQDSSNNVRSVVESFARQGRDNPGRDASASTPNLPLGQPFHGVERHGANTTGTGNGPIAHPSRPHRTTADTANTHMDFRQPHGNNLPTNTGLPVSRIGTTQGRNKQGNTGLPGGMI